MTGIWTNTGEGWELSSPQPFQDEAALHRLIQENIQLLPVAGTPRLTVLGSEIQLGTGYADILAVESSGRPAIIEVKLGSNPEARRAIVSQIIAYAAFLRGFDVESLEQGPLRRALADADYGSILEAVQAQDQEGAVDADSFNASLQGYLDQGNFRLVLVLDEVSAELERVVAYLDAITIQALTIDLIDLKVYDVNGAQVASPQRVSPDVSATMPYTTPDRVGPAASRGILSDGSDVFRASVKGITGESRTTFDDLITWAEQLALQSHVRLFSYAGTRHLTLLPRIVPDDVGLVTIWNDHQRPYVSVWRSVFERLAPNSIESVERTIAPAKIGQGSTVSNITPEVLGALMAAYQEASGD
jgi:hypothetical protein